MRTSKDYTQTKHKLGWSVITNEGLTIAKFAKKETAEDFKENAWCGYYSDCEVKFIVPTLK
jgi:hypothetical protein